MSLSFEIEPASPAEKPVEYVPEKDVKITLRKKDVQPSQYNMMIVVICLLIVVVIVVVWMYPDGKVAGYVYKLKDALYL